MPGNKTLQKAVKAQQDEFTRTREISECIKKMEAAPRFELGVKDLQSSALPLGYTALQQVIILVSVHDLVK